jgi:hypothetical protein
LKSGFDTAALAEREGKEDRIKIYHAKTHYRSTETTTKRKTRRDTKYTKDSEEEKVHTE